MDHYDRHGDDNDEEGNDGDVGCRNIESIRLFVNRDAEVLNANNWSKFKAKVFNTLLFNTLLPLAEVFYVHSILQLAVLSNQQNIGLEKKTEYWAEKNEIIGLRKNRTLGWRKKTEYCCSTGNRILWAVSMGCLSNQGLTHNTKLGGFDIL